MRSTSRLSTVTILVTCLMCTTPAIGDEVRSTAPNTSHTRTAGPSNAVLGYSQDPLLNPAQQPPRINGPSFNSGANDLLRYFGHQRTATQVQPVPAQPVENPGMLRRAYTSTANYVSQSVASGRQAISGLWNWTRAQLDGIKESFLNFQQARRDQSCQALSALTQRLGPRPTYPRAGSCCKAAVNDTLMARGVIPRRIRSNLAKDSLPDLRSIKNSRGKLIFKDITNEIGRDTSRAPIMTVLVYGGPGPGHMEVRTERGYESDFVGQEGIDKRRRDRPLIGAFAVVDPERL